MIHLRHTLDKCFALPQDPTPVSHGTSALEETLPVVSSPENITPASVAHVGIPNNSTEAPSEEFPLITAELARSEEPTENASDNSNIYHQTPP